MRNAVAAFDMPGTGNPHHRCAGELSLARGERLIAPVPASLDFAHALDSHYKTYRIKTYPGETYYIEGRANDVQKFADIAAFFGQYLKDGLRTGASARTAEAK